MTIETIRTMSGRAVRRGLALCALCALVATAAVTWATASPAAAGTRPAATSSAKPSGDGAKPTKTSASSETDEGAASASKARKARKKELAGKLNLNTATEEQLQLLPGVGPAKAERVVAYRTKKGAFKRVADLRNVSGFGYKSLKKLEPYLDIKGESNLAER